MTCKACGWEKTDQAQTKMKQSLRDQGVDEPFPTAYEILGPKPEHTCGPSQQRTRR
jgi:hypothetical protein